VTYLEKHEVFKHIYVIFYIFCNIMRVKNRKGVLPMFFSRKKKALKLAEQQEKAHKLAKQQEMAYKLAEQQEKAELAKREAEKAAIVEKKVEPIKPTPVVKKKVVSKSKVASPKPKASSVNRKVKKPDKDLDKEDTKNAKYHVSQNKNPRSDSYRKWRIRKEGSNKTIKYYETQREAIEYADDLAETAGTSVVIHKMDGSIRKQDYTKKA